MQEPGARITDIELLEGNLVAVAKSNGIVAFLEYGLENGAYEWRSQTQISLEQYIDLSIYSSQNYPLLSFARQHRILFFVFPEALFYVLTDQKNKKVIQVHDYPTRLDILDVYFNLNYLLISSGYEGVQIYGLEDRRIAKLSDSIFLQDQIDGEDVSGVVMRVMQVHYSLLNAEFSNSCLFWLRVGTPYYYPLFICSLKRRVV